LLAASGSELGQAALASVAGGQAALSVDFTRRNEKEADRLGIQMLNKAGYDAHSMASFFEQMYKESRLYGSQGPEFLRTHPVSQNRMAEAKLRANQMSLKQPPSSEMYFLMKERIHILNEPDNERLLDYYQTQIKRGTYTNKNAALYGYAVSLFKNNQFDKAEKIISKLRKQNPSKIAYIIGDAKVAEQAKNYSQATQIYLRALDDFPNNEALVLNYVEVLIKQKDYTKAKSILEEQLRHETTLPIFYKHFAEIEIKLGNTVASHEIMSKYFYIIGQIHQALNRINIALKSPHLDFYTESRLSARKQELESEIQAINNSHS